MYGLPATHQLSTGQVENRVRIARYLLAAFDVIDDLFFSLLTSLFVASVGTRQRPNGTGTAGTRPIWHGYSMPGVASLLAEITDITLSSDGYALFSHAERFFCWRIALATPRGTDYFIQLLNWIDSAAHQPIHLTIRCGDLPLSADSQLRLTGALCRVNNITGLSFPSARFFEVGHHPTFFGVIASHYDTITTLRNVPEVTWIPDHLVQNADHYTIVQTIDGFAWSAAQTYRKGEVHMCVTLHSRFLEPEVDDFIALAPTGDRITHWSFKVDDFALSPTSTLSPDWPTVDTLRGSLPNLSHFRMRTAFTHNVGPADYTGYTQWMENFTQTIFSLLDKVSEDMTVNERADLSFSIVLKFNVLVRGYCSACVRGRLCDVLRPFVIRKLVNHNQSVNSMEWYDIRTPTENTTIILDGRFHIIETNDPVCLPCARPRCEPH